MHRSDIYELGAAPSLEIALARDDSTIAKTPCGRLLDMIAGWALYVAVDEEQGTIDSLVDGDEIVALRHEAETLLVETHGLNAGREEEIARKFVVERLLPVLLRQESAARS